jgi:hypothetical protein
MMSRSKSCGASDKPFPPPRSLVSYIKNSAKHERRITDRHGTLREKRSAHGYYWNGIGALTGMAGIFPAKKRRRAADCFTAGCPTPGGERKMDALRITSRR